MRSPALASIFVCLIAACTSDPRYLQVPVALEVGAPGTEIAPVSASFTLPIRHETEVEAMARGARAAELGVMVPYLDLDDLTLSIEWTIRNLSDEDGSARILVNGANEYFAYVPGAFVIDPDEEEEPPPLLGNVPLSVPATSTVSGVFREDALHEAAIDLELISRGGVNPFTALLRVDEELDVLDGAAPPVPSEAFASLVRFDVTFVADQHMILEVAVRVRDDRSPGRVHDLGVDAPAGELTSFAPADVAPPDPAPAP